MDLVSGGTWPPSPVCTVRLSVPQRSEVVVGLVDPSGRARLTPLSPLQPPSDKPGLQIRLGPQGRSLGSVALWLQLTRALGGRLPRFSARITGCRGLGEVAADPPFYQGPGGIPDGSLLPAASAWGRGHRDQAAQFSGRADRTVILKRSLILEPVLLGRLNNL